MARQGEKNGRHVLTHEQVEEARRLYKKHGTKKFTRDQLNRGIPHLTIQDLALETGVCYSTMQSVISGQTWRYR